MATTRHYILATFFVLVGIACASTGLYVRPPDTTITVENNSFDLITVKVYCGGSQLARLSQIGVSQTASRDVSLARCSRVDVLIDHFSSSREVFFRDIVGVYQGSTLFISVGNSDATTYYRFKE